MNHADAARTVVALLTAGVHDHDGDCCDIYNALEPLDRLRTMAMLVGVCHAHMLVIEDLTGQVVDDQLAVLGLGATEVET